MSKRKEFNSQAKRVTNKEQVFDSTNSGQPRQASQTEGEEIAHGYDKIREDRWGLEDTILGIPSCRKGSEAVGNRTGWRS